jgi:hypothetical protein
MAHLEFTVVGRKWFGPAACGLLGAESKSDGIEVMLPPRELGGCASRSPILLTNNGTLGTHSQHCNSKKEWFVPAACKLLGAVSKVDGFAVLLPPREQAGCAF